MKKISILLLAVIGLLAFNWNSVQADDEGSFEEGKFFFFLRLRFLINIYRWILIVYIFRYAFISY